MALLALQQGVNAPIGSVGVGVSANAPVGAGVLGQGTAINNPSTYSTGPSGGIGGVAGQVANLGAIFGLLNGLFGGNTATGGYGSSAPGFGR